MLETLLICSGQTASPNLFNHQNWKLNIILLSVCIWVIDLCVGSLRVLF